MVTNLLLLIEVAFLPFPTKLVAEAISSTDAERAAVIFYGLSLFVISITLSVIWNTVARDRSLLAPGVTDAEVKAIALRTTPSLGFYVGVILLAIFAPKVAAFGYLAIAILAVTNVRGDRAPRRPTITQN